MALHIVNSPVVAHVAQEEQLRAKVSEVLYVVKSGDTWGSIAKVHFVTTGQVQRANPKLKPAVGLQTGWKIWVPVNTLPSLSHPEKKDTSSQGALNSLKSALSAQSLAADVQMLANNPGSNKTLGSAVNPGKPRDNNSAFNNNPNSSPTNAAAQTTDTTAVGKSIVAGVVNDAINSEIQAQVANLKEQGKDYALISNLQIALNPTVNGTNWANDWSVDTSGAIYRRGSTHLNLQLGTRHQYQRVYGDTGLVLRHLTDGKTQMFGANVFLDKDFTGGNERYGVGAEYFAPYFKSSVNAYQRITDWRQSPFNALRLERAANGYDINATGYLPFFPALSVNGTYFQYFGNEVDVLHNGVFLKNPNGFQVGLTYAPISLYQVSLNYTQSSAQTSLQLSLGVNYLLGVPLEKQMQPIMPSSVGDVSSMFDSLVVRNYTPVLEEKDKKTPLLFQNGSNNTLYIGLNTPLIYSLGVTGGLGALGYQLTGVDANKFVLNPATQILSWNGPPPSANSYTVTITVTDGYGDSASQNLTVHVGPTVSANDVHFTRENPQPNEGIYPRSGDKLDAAYKFEPGSTGLVEDKTKTKFIWFLNDKVSDAVGTGVKFDVDKKYAGKTLSLGVMVAAYNPKDPSRIIYAPDYTIAKLGPIDGVIPETAVVIMVDGKLIETTPPVITKNFNGSSVAGTTLTANIQCAEQAQGKECLPGKTLGYQWQEWTSQANKTWVNITGATSTSYGPTANDLGRGIRVVVKVT